MKDIQEEFLDILDKNIGIVIKISRAYTKVEQDREDLINDITLQLWKSFNSFKSNSKISTWIYRVAINTAMNYQRNRKNELLLSSLDDIKLSDLHRWLPPQNNSSELELLYSCIDELCEINKAIILLYLDGNSHDEISEIMGISKTNVGTRIGRIKDQIKSIATSKK
jgi:RNA polymerase sigma factor (sigma-70 family)